MSEKEQASFACRFSGNAADDLNSKDVQSELNKKVIADLTGYALHYLASPADDLIEDIFSRVKALADNNRFYKTTITNSGRLKSQRGDCSLLPPNWKRQLITFLLPAVTMDKRILAPGNKKR